MNILGRFSLLILVMGIAFAGSLQAKPKNKKYFSYKSTKNDVSVSIRELSPQECKQRTGHKISSSGRNRDNSIIPLAVKVTNNTGHFIKFSKDDIRLKMVSPNEVQRHIQSMSRIYSFGGAALTFLLFPVCCIVGLWVAMFNIGSIWLAEAALLGIMAVGFVPIVFGGVKGYQEARSTYRNIVAPYEALGVDYIDSGETQEMIVYTRTKDLKNFSGLSVKDAKTHQTIVFGV